MIPATASNTAHGGYFLQEKRVVKQTHMRLDEAVGQSVQLVLAKPEATICRPAPRELRLLMLLLSMLSED